MTLANSSQAPGYCVTADPTGSAADFNSLVGNASEATAAWVQDQSDAVAATCDGVLSGALQSAAEATVPELPECPCLTDTQELATATAALTYLDASYATTCLCENRFYCWDTAQYLSWASEASTALDGLEADECLGAEDLAVSEEGLYALLGSLEDTRRTCGFRSAPGERAPAQRPSVRSRTGALFLCP